MPDSLVSVADLKAILGIGDLYPDATLEQIGQAATNVILSYLQLEVAFVDQISDETGFILTCRTTRAHQFYVGQDVILAGFPGAHTNGNKTVDSVPDETTVLVDLGAHAAPVIADPIALRPPASIADRFRVNYYEDVPEVLAAVTAVAVDMFQSRIAPGGQMEAVDFTPGPYRMGRSLLTRVSGLLGRWMDVGSLVG